VEADELEVTRDRHREGAISGGAIAELAVEVLAPAVDAAIGEKSAGVDRAGRYGPDRSWKSDDLSRAEAVFGCPVTQLSEGVVPPAIDVVSPNPACVIGSGGERLEGAGDPCREKAVHEESVPQLAV
jgi:hypothetical protein